MDALPPLTPDAGWKKEGSTSAWFVALGLAFLLSLAAAVGLALRRLSAAQTPAGSEAESGPLSFPCPMCGKMLKVKAELAGKKVKCPQCGKPLVVPETQTTEPALTPGRSWWACTDVRTAVATSGLLAALLFLAGWLAPAETALRQPHSGSGGTGADEPKRHY